MCTSLCSCQVTQCNTRAKKINLYQALRSLHCLCNRSVQSLLKMLHVHDDVVILQHMCWCNNALVVLRDRWTANSIKPMSNQMIGKQRKHCKESQVTLCVLHAAATQALCWHLDSCEQLSQQASKLQDTLLALVLELGAQAVAQVSGLRCTWIMFYWLNTCWN
jgi:hypothetical protein